MKYYLSASVPDLLSEEPLSVRVNNLQIKKIKRMTTVKASFGVSQPNDEDIMRLNKLAATRPFCSTHKAKRFDPL